jgi:hypothetical protein
MCANGTIVTDIFVGSVYLAIVVYLPQSTKHYYSRDNRLFSGSPKKG